MYDPAKDSVKVLLGLGQEERADGTQNTYSFTQVQGLCSLGKVLFVTCVATGAVKLGTGLAGTVSFVKTLGCLYDIQVWYGMFVACGIRCLADVSSTVTLANTLSHRRQTYHIKLVDQTHI